MAKFRNSSFVSSSMQLDGQEFEACMFNACELIYAGGPAPILNGCSFRGCNWQFVGPAGNTLAFLTGMYHGGMRPVVENIFQAIRTAPAQLGTTEPAPADPTLSPSE